MKRHYLALLALLIVIALLTAAGARALMPHPHSVARPGPQHLSAAPSLPRRVPAAPTVTVVVGQRSPTPTPSVTHSADSSGPVRLVGVLDAAAPLPLSGPASVTPALLDTVLGREGSPLAGLGHYIAAEGRRWQIDPVFLLAFTAYLDSPHPLPVAAHNVGHIVAIAGAPTVGGYRAFGSWQAGITAWYRLIHDLYQRQWGLSTLDAVVPVYAPGRGRADSEATLGALRALVSAWRCSTRGR